MHHEHSVISYSPTGHITTINPITSRRSERAIRPRLFLFPPGKRHMRAGHGASSGHAWLWSLGDAGIRRRGWTGVFCSGICRPGRKLYWPGTRCGLVILSYTVWLGPFGGHETGFWAHYLGGNFARDNYTKRHGHKPKNVFGISLFDVSCSSGIRWASQTNAKVVTLFPRYHPKWAWWFVSMPVFREFFVSNLVIVLQKATPNEGR